jgi:hypothetical protein
MKARDIIPGWPRGRSSSRPIHIPEWFRFAYYRMMVERSGHPVFGPSDASFGDFTRTSITLFFEAEAQAQYRAEQNRKVAEWRINSARIDEAARKWGETYGFVPDENEAILFQFWCGMQAKDYYKLVWGDEYRSLDLVAMQEAADKHGAVLLYEEDMRRKS